MRPILSMLLLTITTSVTPTTIQQNETDKWDYVISLMPDYTTLNTGPSSSLWDNICQGMLLTGAITVFLGACSVAGAIASKDIERWFSKRKDGLVSKLVAFGILAPITIGPALGTIYWIAAKPISKTMHTLAKQRTCKTIANILANEEPGTLPLPVHRLVQVYKAGSMDPVTLVEHILKLTEIYQGAVPLIH